MKICSVETCNNYVFGKGYCKNHQYLRNDIKKSINKISEKQIENLKEYSKVRKEYLTKNLKCEFPGCNQVSTDIHHMKGRIGELLTDTSFFKALCRTHHTWCEENPNEAKELGLSLNRNYEARNS